MRLLACCLSIVVALCGCASGPATLRSSDAAIVRVKLIAFNDFHGNLETPSVYVKAPASGLGGDVDGPGVTVPAGGAARFATLVATLRAQNPNNAVVSSGDMIGASPLVSSLFLDEPTIEAMNRIGVDFNSVGNHEFDRGVAELLRKQTGGCERHAVALEPCAAGHRFEGARFPFLAANVIDRATGKPIFPAYGIKSFDGVKVGFIGLTLRDTRYLVDPAGIAGVRFTDEADAINAAASELRSQGVHALVVLIHQGGAQDGLLNDRSCPGLHGDILPILDRLDPTIDVVASAHTHEPYVCSYHGFLLTSAAAFGRLVTDIDLEIDRASGRVVRKAAVNRVVASEGYAGVPPQPAYPLVPPDAAMAAHVATYAALVAPIANRKVGSAPSPLSKDEDAAGQTPLGDLFVDADLAATRGAGARIAFLNPGSVRVSVEPAVDGTVSYGALHRAQPFGNNLVTMTLDGSEIKALLEQQWIAERDKPAMLQVSQGFSFAYDDTKPIGSRVVADSMRLDGAALSPSADYRVTVNSFMASGGDGFTVLRAGRDVVVGRIDIDAAVDYFAANSPVTASPSGRVRRLGR